MDEYSRIVDLLKSGKRFIVASHYNPDGDGIGSTIAMALALEGMGKSVVRYNRDPVPANLSFLSGADKFTRTLDRSEKFDIAIMVDCSGRKRVSDDFANYPGLGKIICVDHHLMEKTDADESLIDSDAASAGEVVLRLMRHAKMEITREVAQCIYTTLVVDTGFFRYSSTNAAVLALAAELVKMGAEPWTVAKHLDESYPASRMRLLALSLASLDFALDGRYAFMAVTQKMLAASGATMDLSDEFATYPRQIEGVEVAGLFRELDGGRTKVSLRSKDAVDVAAIAKNFGGGGHARAAGFQIKTTIEEAKAKVLNAIKTALE